MNEICEAAARLFERGVTPTRLVMSHELGSYHGIHGTHYSTPSGDLMILYDNMVTSIVIEGVREIIETEVVEFNQESSNVDP